jgi:6-pyruvoyltetrahydropterin/6-carboxytetrahydropterin synthase
LIVTLKGDVDPETGYVMDLKKLNDLMEEQVCSYMDHRNLNMDIAEFEDLIPTAENIAVVIWNRMRRVLPENLELRITLYETERNFVEYSGN